jgi:hypothetical protein
MFLPRLIADRMEYCSNRGDDESSLEPLKGEMLQLIEVCSSGSFYAQMCREGASEESVKRMKKLANILMNSPESKADNNRIWRGLKHMFPHCLRIITAIKREDHRKISGQFQHFTANAINRALLDLQIQGIPAVPDTDCLIVRERDKAATCSPKPEAFA